MQECPYTLALSNEDFSLDAAQDDFDQTVGEHRLASEVSLAAVEEMPASCEDH